MASSFTTALALFALVRTAVSQSAVAETYLSGQWRDERGCLDLQLNISATSIITDKNIHLFTNINDLSNSTNLQFEIEILIGTIPLSTAFKTDQYEIEWKVSPNFAYEDYFLGGDGSKIVFQGQYREKFNVAGIGSDLVTFDPSTWGMSTIDWPSNLPEEAIPGGARAVANVPQLGMTYISGPMPSTTKDNPNEVFAYNFTSGDVTRHNAPAKLWSSASFVPVGKKGMLVMIGGVERSDLETPVSLEDIHVYDIAEDKWYLQPTTGRTPPDRKSNCAVVTSASDGSSHQIHVYGGTRPLDKDYDPLIDNYWILSVPQFVWTKGPLIPDPRSGTSCNLLGNHRMLIAAGYATTTCVQLLQIVDLNTGNVTTEFGVDDTSPYEIPDFVLKDIGGDVTGGSTLKPTYVSGLEAAWNQDYIYDTKTNNTTPGADDNTSSTGGTKTPTAAIVGGTVGGVAAGVLLLGGFLFMRRRNKQKAAAAAAAAEPTQPPMDNVVRDAGPYDPSYAGAYNHRDSVYSTDPPNYGSKSPAPTYTTPGFPDLQEVHGESTSPTSVAHELPGNDAPTQ
ncbi:uncharacterized protein LAJ45_06886 [Morchella importuna]|uniref:uncharacterized protein n=1 Tax=Morchella importuna TaxID=1174673 RepID=UPI001E8DBC73|nr:uncharacterized protein LAJ45_06886 [Morchella importuna]KAH8148912.1 hypothetical protein LAJ45_06886 [Morchella importuna]